MIHDFRPGCPVETGVKSSCEGHSQSLSFSSDFAILNDFIVWFHQVCIWVPDEQILISNDASVANLSAWADTFTSFYNSFFALVYSDVCIPAKSKGSYTICEARNRFTFG